MTYSLEWDVYGLDGKVIYAKGYKINPGDLVKLDHTPVVIDGEDPGQVKWFGRKWGARPDVVLLVTDGVSTAGHSDPASLKEAVTVSAAASARAPTSR